MNQNKINKILIAIIFIVISLMIYSRMTEQKRVDYYICYNQMISIEPTKAEENAIRDYCKERID